jgi:aspartyl-tRNA(Asn)/glutamyl-tRNA(Gln) amidotransferase subunit A
MLGFDAMVVPTVAVAAPPLAAFADDAEYLRLNLLILRNTTLINLLDGCAITLPIEAPGSLPIGLSLAGITGADKAILGMARSVERLLREQAR